MVIGLHGKARSGKDTAYGYIEEWAIAEGQAVRRDAFADRLKFSAARAVGFRGDRYQCVAMCNRLKEPGWEVIVREQDGATEHVISGREFLQFYGTEAHREVFGKDFWIDAVLDSYNAHGELLVITDVRFPNEAEAVLDEGGEVWHIIRPDADIAEDAHASEQALAPELITHTIQNNQDLAHLKASVYTQLSVPEHA